MNKVQLAHVLSSAFLFAGVVPIAAQAQEPRTAPARQAVDISTFPKPSVSTPEECLKKRASALAPVYWPCNYMSALQRKVTRVWAPPKDAVNARVKVGFSIARDGKVDNLHIVVSSHTAAADAAAMKAIEDASPFGPLPSGTASPVNFEFTFPPPSSDSTHQK